MNQEHITQVLIAPHISEKSTIVADKLRQHVFRVIRSADKLEVRKAVEKLFNVKVESVRIVNTQGKNKSFQRQMGRRQNWKKAYVRLAAGHDINFEGGEKA
ncbi:MAG TPA: 50S ribosomal protein L23 [Gammaproteobacteria bacterium]